MRASAYRRLSALVLAVWLAPSLGALAVAVHLAFDHHGHHGGDPAGDLAELARSVAHGHRHDVATAPDHEHEARIDEPEPALRPSPALVAVVPSPATAAVLAVDRRRPDQPPDDGPPVPLVLAHPPLLL